MPHSEDEPIVPFQILKGSSSLKTGVKLPRSICPTFKAGDPRIEETFRSGSGVGIDYSGLTDTQRDRYERRYADLVTRSSEGRRFRADELNRDVDQDAIRAMSSDNDRFPQDSEEEDESEDKIT